MILRWAEEPQLRMLMCGRARDVQVRRLHLPMGRNGFEIHIQVANAWQQLSPGDEAFFYDPALLLTSERSRLMLAVGSMLTAEFMVDKSELDEAVSSILNTYRD